MCIRDRPLKCRVRLVHHRKKRILDDRDELLFESYLFMKSGCFVIEIDPNVFRIPLDYFSNSKRLYVETAGSRWIDCGVDGNNCRNASVEKLHGNVLLEVLSSLIDVRFDLKAVAQPALDVFEILSGTVDSNVSDVHRRNVDTETRVDSSDNRPLVGITETNSVWRPGSETSIARERSGKPIRFLVCESVPSVFDRLLEPISESWHDSPPS